MNIEVDTVKGFQDYLPPESLKREAVKTIIEKYFKLYGFAPIETPIIEFDELMKPSSLPSEGQDDAISERFKLKDRGGRNLGLRYEFTFQLSRLFRQNPNLKTPFKRFQIGPVFRDEPTRPGRFRQFVQCDVDTIGDSSINADAELLALTSDILKELKITPEIEVNNRKLLKAIIESAQIPKAESVMRELDKLDKLGEDVVKTNLKKYTSSNQIITLFKLLEKDLKFFQENKFDGLDELQTLMSQCKNYGVKVKFNPFMIRGLGYYTGNIFEIKVAGQKDTIAAGGRYDNSVGKYINRQVPAVGISFGLDRVSSLAQVPVKSQALALVISIGQDKAVASLAKTLRKSGVSCITTSDKISKSLEYANAQAIPYAIFVGESEIIDKKFKLKDLTKGEEKEMTEKALTAFLKKKI